MAIVNDSTLKGYFVTGAIPTQANFADLVDSKLSVQGGSISGNLTVSGDVQATGDMQAIGDIRIGIADGVYSERLQVSNNMLVISGSGGIINVANSDTSASVGQDIGAINFVGYDANTGADGVRASFKGIYEGTSGAAGIGFYTSANANTPTQKMLLSSAGNLTVSGGIYLGGTASANLLDDFEQGTFTPTVYGSIAGSGSPATLDPNDNEFTYTKLKDRVIISGGITVTASNSINGTLLVTHPFGNSNNIHEGYIRFKNANTLGEKDFIIVTPSNTTTLRVVTPNNISVANEITNTSELRIQITILL